ncbi:GNAT family N-acetyltransferase [Shewanella frigidimarina]|uniref:GNAT family N-acetyltransferase n=1 Tax=Shewanella frigidimarina TaxID=56812 RepID=UPI003D7BCA8E
MMKIVKLRNTELVGELLDNLVASAIAPLVDTYDDYRFIATLCAESIASIEHGVCSLFMVREGNKSLASACVFDPFDEESGCYHVNHIATYKKYREKGLGRLLMNTIIENANEFSVTLESSESSRTIFEKLGFKVREKTATGLYAMYFGKLDHDRFKKLELKGEALDAYNNRALNALVRIGALSD